MFDFAIIILSGFVGTLIGIVASRIESKSKGVLLISILIIIFIVLISILYIYK